MGYSTSMTRVLIAADESDVSIHAARVAYDLFGDAADYAVVTVGRSTPMLWGTDELQPGVSYPIVIAPAGGGFAVPQFMPSLAVRGPADGGTTTATGSAEEQAGNVARAAGIVGAETIGEVGDTVDTIINAAEEHQADVIVVGARHHTLLAEMFTSSVTKSVVRKADRPVLVVP